MLASKEAGQSSDGLEHHVSHPVEGRGSRTGPHSLEGWFTSTAVIGLQSISTSGGGVLTSKEAGQSSMACAIHLRKEVVGLPQHCRSV